MSECEAERRNKQALYVLENEWGCGRINIGEMQRLLRGPECECEGGPNVQPARTH